MLAGCRDVAAKVTGVGIFGPLEPGRSQCGSASARGLTPAGRIHSALWSRLQGGLEVLGHFSDRRIDRESGDDRMISRLGSLAFFSFVP